MLTVPVRAAGTENMDQTDYPMHLAGSGSGIVSGEEPIQDFVCQAGCLEPEFIYIAGKDILTPIEMYEFAQPNSQVSAAMKAYEKYNDDYAYKCFGKEAKGAAKQTLYNRIDAIASRFHSDCSINATSEYAELYGRYTVGVVEYASLGLTTEEACIVMYMYRNDHPLYYWLSNSALGTSQHLWVTTTEEYDEGLERKYYNGVVEKTIGEYMEIVEGETSAYRIALAIHDMMVETIDYAMEEDGVTPSDTRAAHNILGVLAEEGPVCESYARAFQILLNAAGVDCLYVTGSTGEGRHAWNLVCLDDGQWYWYDPTWGDMPSSLWGIQYQYFCMNDTETSGWTITGKVSSETFMDSHIPEMPRYDGSLYLYPLPERSSAPYAARGNEVLLLEGFYADDLYYIVVGGGRVQCAAFRNIGTDLVIPDTVEYNGIRYDVISVGCFNQSGLMSTGAMGYEGAAPKNVVIGKNVRYIWDYALQYSTVKSFTADPKNQYYSTQDGVLYTKNKYTLVEYPDASDMVQYTIPNETRRIFYNAFHQCSSLKTLTVGENVNMIGIYSYGSAYHDGMDPQKFRSMSGSWYSLHVELAGTGTIEISSANDTFFKYDGCFYENIDGGLKFLLCPYKINSSDPVNILEKTVSIEYAAFTNCSKLKKVVIPASVTELKGFAFGYCRALTEVYFLGNPPKSVAETAFKGISSSTLTMYYSPSSEGWTDFRCIADDGNAFKILPFPHTHSYDVWMYDGKNHWQSCSCGQNTEELPHADTDKNGVCDTCGYRMLCTVKGKITSFGSAEDSIVIELIPVGETEAVIRSVLDGNASAYVLEDVIPDRYILRISKKNHVPREYELDIEWSMLS